MPADRKSPLSPMSQPMEASALHGDRGGVCAPASDARRVDAQTTSAARQLNGNFTFDPPKSFSSPLYVAGSITTSVIRSRRRSILDGLPLRLRGGLGAKGFAERFHGDGLVPHLEDL